MRAYHTKIIVASLLLTGAAAALIVLGARSARIYYVHTDEFFREEAKYLHRDLRLNGSVRTGSLVRGPQPLHVAFDLGGGEGVIKVTYVGAAPDALKEGADVVVEGRYEGGRVLAAKTLMTKCPSKYEAKNKPTAVSSQLTVVAHEP